MNFEQNRKPAAKSFLSIRMDADQKAMVVQAAEREGLQISSFIIMLLVRCRILPESCLKRIKRRPVPLFNALHGLLGIVNKIGGSCKQLAVVYPDMTTLRQTQAKIIQTAVLLTDALQGKKIPEDINLYRMQGDLTQRGYVLNQIAKSVNSGRPSLEGLPAVLRGINQSACAVIAALNGGSMPKAKDLFRDAENEVCERRLTSADKAGLR